MGFEMASHGVLRCYHEATILGDSLAMRFIMVVFTPWCFWLVDSIGINECFNAFWY